MIGKFLNKIGGDMSIISSGDNSAQQKINELERKIQREKTKIDREMTRKKILLGSFLIQVLEDDSVTGMREFTADNLGEFLTRKTDRNLMSDVIDNLNRSKEDNTAATNNNSFGQSVDNSFN